jgi:hypothetical protein
MVIAPFFEAELPNTAVIDVGGDGGALEQKEGEEEEAERE